MRAARQVTAMDKSIGEVLRAVRGLGIQRNTLVVFLSDNGPEDIAGLAGTTAGYKGRKRSVYEGGIRVPAIFQWVGTIPRGAVIDSFGMSTDLLPTFMHAAGLALPTGMPVDGMSLLPTLTGGGEKRQAAPSAAAQRVSLWMNDFEGPRSAAAWIFDFKLLFNQSDLPAELYDMRSDPFEENNLLLRINLTVDAFAAAAAGEVFSEESLRASRQDPALHAWVVSRSYRALADWAAHGNEAHALYLRRHPWRTYKPSIMSSQRHGIQLFLAIPPTLFRPVTTSLICNDVSGGQPVQEGVARESRQGAPAPAVQHHVRRRRRPLQLRHAALRKVPAPRRDHTQPTTPLLHD